MLWRMHCAAAIFTLLPAFAASNSGLIQVTGVRSWSHADSTRVILETTGPFEFHTDRAENPDRLFVDVLHARPFIAGRRIAIHAVNDSVIRRVRVAETSPGTTRVVFDLVGPATFKVSRLDTPDRMVVEIVKTIRRKPFVYPPMPIHAFPVVTLAGPAPMLDVTPPLRTVFNVSLPPSKRPVRMAASATPPTNAPLSTRSLTRALGLKVSRIVIDAGHGGHDFGTIGPNGVSEKEVVLDVALRLEKLVRTKMGAEVVLTRTDDTFIPLHERTVIANDHKADLFLSIHANSSSAPSVAGTETFFLNFTTSSSALDVASRENAGSGKQVSELKDLIQSITLNDKIAESQMFAQTVQETLFAQAARSNVMARNRGVKRAPFVVLIGASMPSVLAEIGFLSNPKDETNLSKPEYRQKIAEALYKGLSQYSQSLERVQVSASR